MKEITLKEILPLVERPSTKIYTFNPLNKGLKEIDIHECGKYYDCVVARISTSPICEEIKCFNNLKIESIMNVYVRLDIKENENE